MVLFPEIRVKKSVEIEIRARAFQNCPIQPGLQSFYEEIVSSLTMMFYMKTCKTIQSERLFAVGNAVSGVLRVPVAESAKPHSGTKPACKNCGIEESATGTPRTDKTSGERQA